MKRKPLIAIALACSLLLPSSFAMAVDQATEQKEMQAQGQEHVYGSQMMTAQERNEYRARMNAAKTNQEREQIRMEHHERMQERAKEQGVSMPDSPPPRGSGKGSGMGGSMGGGMGGGKGKNK